MVDKLKNLIKKIKAEKGEILLCMLWKDSPEINKWTFIVSAEWIDALSQQTAFNYWVTQLSSVLNKDELNSISRITFLKSNEAFVDFIGSLINASDSSIHLKDTSLGKINVTEAIIFESHRKIPIKKKSIKNRNPIFNHSINPIFNHSINPIFNHSINPIFNHSINPIFNHSINPIFNHSINPLYNPTFDGFYLFDNSNAKLGYIINANDDVILIFNADNTLQSFGVRNSVKGYTLFNNNNAWIGQILPDGDDGYNFFSHGNEWVGYLK